MQGVITGVMRKGFFLQTPNATWDGKCSDAVFVYAPETTVEKDAHVKACGEVVDYLKHDTARPVTQIHLDALTILGRDSATANESEITAVELSNQLLPNNNAQLASLLNSLEGMLVSVPAGQTFIAPSNPFGDYVLVLDTDEEPGALMRSEHNGVIPDHDNHLRWFPGFRVTNYNHAPRLNVGSRLLTDIKGPLHYRVDSYQMAVSEPFKVDHNYISVRASSLQPEDGAVTIMTLNCFNLDPHIESEDRVLNPRQDIDDDWGEGRFHTLAQAVVLQANTPDIVALQEIQDNDGAEISEVVDASKTYELLIQAIDELASVRYSWVDINPEVGADGGQPGGNIRNGYLYNPERVSLVEGSAQIFGADAECFEGSRKPLRAEFKERSSGKPMVCINLHLASKRHQNSIFAPLEPGEDKKLSVRVAQASTVCSEIEKIRSVGKAYYVTGDFNDTEHSATLQAMLGEHSINLVESLPAQERYDYNRGKLQVLMHGVIDKDTPPAKASYEIIHGNELIGVKPGEESDKPSDHAYVIAKLVLD